MAGSALLSRRLKRQTLGLEPHELAELVAEREAVLHGVGEGVLATDPTGRVSVRNDEAARLLGQAAAPGTAAADLDVPPPLLAVLAGRAEAHNMLTVVGDRVLVVNRTGVRRAGRDLGAVVTLRDRTDLEALTRELDTVRTLTDALRAQGHEHANRLHTLSGLLQLGHHDEAAEYLQALTESRPDTPGGPEAVRDPYLRAFLAAKSAVAAEKAVRLGVDEASWVPARVLDPVAVTTVLGNLVDNALDAARLGARRPAWVEVELLADGDTLHLTVADSGDGVPDALRDSVFAEGVSTKDSGGGRGLGLALARQAAGRYDGTVSLADPGGPRHGADGARGAGPGRAELPDQAVQPGPARGPADRLRPLPRAAGPRRRVGTVHSGRCGAGAARRGPAGAADAEGPVPGHRATRGGRAARRRPGPVRQRHRNGARHRPGHRPAVPVRTGPRRAGPDDAAVRRDRPARAPLPLAGLLTRQRVTGHF